MQQAEDVLRAHRAQAHLENRRIRCEMGSTVWEGALAAWLAANAEMDDITRVTQDLLQGKEVTGGGGAAPTYCVYPLPEED